MIKISPRDGNRRLDIPSAERAGGKSRKKSTKSRLTKGDGGGAKPARKKTAGKKLAKKTGHKSLLAKLFTFCVLAVVWGGVAVGGLVAWYALDLPDIDKLSATTRQPSLTLFDRQGETIATYGDLYGRPIQAGEMPAALIQAVMATEDRRFFEHFGVDVIGLTRAMWTNLRRGRVVQGGSTITQQIAKNLFLTPDRTLKRKVQEALLSFWLEHKFTKDELLTIYLNRVYLGAGTYGISSAANRYFGKNVRDLSIYESAMIAGLLKAPSRFAPTRNLELAKSRAAQVLANMVNAGYLTPEAAAVARGIGMKIKAQNAPLPSTRYFIDWVLSQVPDYVGAVDYDLIVTTTLDLSLQKIAETDLVELVDKAGEQVDARQAALVSMAPGGAVRAMVGGRDYADSQFNRATQARRQPGSSFKMMVYLAGLESGLTPDDILPDAPIEIEGWSPKNYNGKFNGPMTLSQAFIRSVNSVAVRVSEKAGRAKVREVARRLGLTTSLPNGPALALGVGEASLIEMTAAYAVLANQGNGVWAYGIEEIRTPEGEILYQRMGSGPGRIIAKGNVARLHEMLAGVIREGTGRSANIGRPIAGKTGTSQDFRDAWFIGYSADLVTGVWFGNDNNTPMDRVTGGGLPARLWQEYMLAAHKGLPSQPLPGSFDYRNMDTFDAAFSTPEGLVVTVEEDIPPPRTSTGFWGEIVGRLGF